MLNYYIKIIRISNINLPRGRVCHVSKVSLQYNGTSLMYQRNIKTQLQEFGGKSQQPIKSKKTKLKTN